MEDRATQQRARRQASVIAGVSLLILAVLGAFANFGVLESLVTEGNAAQTSEDILASATLFRIGIASLVLVAALDVVVAWALMTVFRPVHGRLSQLTAWFRIIYAGIFAAGISMLPGVLRLLDTSDGLAAIPMDQRQAQAFLRIETFDDVWNIWACPLWRSSPAPRISGVPIGICAEATRHPDRDCGRWLRDRQLRQPALRELHRGTLHLHLHR